MTFLSSAAALPAAPAARKRKKAASESGGASASGHSTSPPAAAKKARVAGPKAKASRADKAEDGDGVAREDARGEQWVKKGDCFTFAAPLHPLLLHSRQSSVQPVQKCAQTHTQWVTTIPGASLPTAARGGRRHRERAPSCMRAVSAATHLVLHAQLPGWHDCGAGNTVLGVPCAPSCVHASHTAELSAAAAQVQCCHTHCVVLAVGCAT